MGIEQRSYQPGDEEAILALFETVFGRSLPMDTWAWRYRDNPAGHGLIVCAWDGPRLAAHYAVARVTLQARGRPVPACLSMTTMTHPDYRGLGLFTTLARATYQGAAEAGVRLVYGFPNDNSYPGFVRKLAWRDLGDVPELVRPLAGDVREPAGGVRLAQVADGEALAGLAIPDPVPEGCLAIRRDAAYLGWRYLRNPSARYEVLAASAAGEALGLVVLKYYDASDHRKAHLMEYLVAPARPEAEHRAVLSAVARHAGERGASVLTTWCLEHTPMAPVLAGAGFVPGAYLTHFGALAFGAGEDALLTRGGLYITLGDSDVF